MRTKTLLMLGVLLLGAALTACGSAAAAQSPAPAAQSGTDGNPSRTLSVSGSGKAFLSPDIAYINIGVHTEGQDAAEAVANNNAESQQVIDAIQALGVQAKDIQTLNFSIYPQQQYDPQGRPLGEITYMVDNSVYVTVRDLTQIGDLLDTAVSAGANSINGIQFDVANRDAALSEARKAAVANAQAQAQELAEIAGVTLGGIQNLSTASGGIPPVPIYMDRGGGGVAAEAASTPISPGQMVVTVDVTVVYLIQ